MISRFCACFSGRKAAEAGETADPGGIDAHRANRGDAKVADESKKAQNGVLSKPGGGGKASNLGAVLVELFTSQGSSACPQADLFVSKLGRADSSDSMADPAATSVPVVVLAYHVDYWDYLGWKDPFAGSLWSVRQRAYVEALRQDSIYSPEVVVQGRSHCIGSDSEALSSLVASAPRFAAPDIHASYARPSSSTLEVSLSVTLKFKVENCNLDIIVAMYETGHVTDCSSGENRGRVLTNDFVVRALEKACTVRDWSQRKPVKGQVTFKLWEGFSKVKWGMAVFFQNSSSMEVYGAHQLQLPEDA